jgi:hypothetical protein
MTLVVARILDQQISIVADTLITNLEKPLPLSQGMVKSCMLASRICVSYAGSPELASKDIWQFSKLFPHDADFMETVKFFEQSSKLTGNEYILAFAKNPKIVKIVNGRRQTGTSKTQWIGDKAAYELFRAHEAKLRDKTERNRAISAVLVADEPVGSPASDLYSIMRHVVRENESKTVGGFVSVVSNLEGNFRHPCLSDILFDWPASEPPEFELKLEDNISFGSSGENEDFSVSIFTTAYANFTFIGFYFLRGNIAYVFHPTRTLMADTCTVIREVPPNELPKKLTEIFGRDYGWLIWIAGPSPIKKSTERYFDNGSDGGNQFGIMMHCNTFPASGEKRKLPPLNLYFPGLKS